MNKLPLKIDGRWECKERLYTPLDTIQRVITSLRWRFFVPDQLKLVPLLNLSQVTVNIRTLEFSHTIMYSSTFAQLLNYTVNLKDLKIRYSTIIGNDTMISSLSFLESLTIDGTADLKFLNIIANNTGLRSIKISSLFNQISATAVTQFTSFLLAQKYLKSFEGHHCGALYEDLSEFDFIFKLERLVIEELIFGRRPATTMAGMKKFIAKHRATLENLEISGNYCSELIPFVMQELRVKRLKIDGMNVWFRETVLFEQIPANHFLKELEFKSLGNFMDTGRILQVYPSIEYLKIAKWDYADINIFLRCIASSLKKLVVLDIPRMSSSAAQVSMPSLKMVKLNGVCYNLQDWTTRMVNTSNQSVHKRPLLAKLNYDISVPKDHSLKTSRTPRANIIARSLSVICETIIKTYRQILEILNNS